MVRRTLSKASVDADPGCLWNAVVNLLAMEHYEALSLEQRPAHLVFWYNQEVQNGGHLQYFENRGIERVGETIDALEQLGARPHRDMLIEALRRYESKDRPPIETVEEYVVTALEGEFEDLDDRFYRSELTLEACLERHLAQHTEWFVEIT